MLLGLAGHEIRTAKDGVEALLVAQAFRPQVVFLDIGMPKLDGYETARELRKQPWAEEVALFALTGWGQAKDKRRAQEAGFDAHIVKPLDIRDLDRIIASLRREWSRRRYVPACLARRNPSSPRRRGPSGVSGAANG